MTAVHEARSTLVATGGGGDLIVEVKSFQTFNKLPHEACCKMSDLGGETQWHKAQLAAKLSNMGRNKELNKLRKRKHHEQDGGSAGKSRKAAVAGACTARSKFKRNCQLLIGVQRYCCIIVCAVTKRPKDQQALGEAVGACTRRVLRAA